MLLTRVSELRDSNQVTTSELLNSLFTGVVTDELSS